MPYLLLYYSFLLSKSIGTKLTWWYENSWIIIYLYYQCLLSFRSVSLIPVDNEVHLIQPHVIKICQHLQEFCGFLQVLWLSLIKLITWTPFKEILMKVALNTNYTSQNKKKVTSWAGLTVHVSFSCVLPHFKV